MESRQSVDHTRAAIRDAESVGDLSDVVEQLYDKILRLEARLNLLRKSVEVAELGYPTEDGCRLRPGDHCWVIVRCTSGEHNLSDAWRPAWYKNAHAVSIGREFCLVESLRSDCDCFEITAVSSKRPY